MYRWIAAVGGAGLLALGTDACGDDEESSSAQAAQPEPVAQIDAPSGQKTEVTLDAGFVDALGTLKLTRAPVGDGQDHQVRDRALPGTGGNVTYYEPGSVSPFVQARSTTTGAVSTSPEPARPVELTDFVVDPGASVLTGTVTVAGEVAAASAPSFFLDGRTLRPLQSEGSTAVLEGTTVKLKDEAATHPVQ